ncbi:hypothetical protein ABMA32_17985 [Mesorhizobium sp. VNQ89]
MKRYEKPQLNKRVVLQAVAAQSIYSPPPDSTGNGNENGDDEGGVII